MSSDHRATSIVGLPRIALCLGAVAVALLGMGRRGYAVMLAAGGSGTPNGSFSLVSDTFNSTVSSSYTGTETITGIGTVNYDFTLTTTVYTNSVTGGLDFVYQLTNTGPLGDSDSFERLTVSDFSSFTVNADYATLTGSNSSGPADIAPNSVDRPQSSTVGFNFASAISAQEETDELIVRTNATSYGNGSGTVIDGLSNSVAIDAPMVLSSGGVPEPGTFALLSISALGCLARRRRATR